MRTLWRTVRYALAAAVVLGSMAAIWYCWTWANWDPTCMAVALVFTLSLIGVRDWLLRGLVGQVDPEDGEEVPDT